VAFTAFLDASVLFPIGLCDSLLWIAALDLYSPRWSADVLAELRRNILKEYPDMDPGEIDQRIADMQHAFSEAEVTGYQRPIPAMPADDKDKHVLAGAVLAKAGVLVTNNLKDFDLERCAELGVEVQSADEFLSHALSLDPVTVHQALTKQAAIKKNPSMTVADVLARLEWTAPNFVREARGAWGIPAPYGDERG
jgi:predicted nucleic acid-binding protein